MPASSPRHRNAALLRIFAVARRCGRLDARGQLGDLSSAALGKARYVATEAGCGDANVDDATCYGLEVGRRGGTESLWDMWGHDH